MRDHNAAKYLEIVYSPERRSKHGGDPSPPGWYVIRTCRCHEDRPVTRLYETKFEAQCALLLMVQASTALGY